MDQPTPAVPPVANAAKPVGSKKPNWKIWLIVGGVAIAVALLALLLMRNRSKRLSEELERRNRAEMAEKSKQELAAMQMMHQQYYSQYPPGLMPQYQPPASGDCSGGVCQPEPTPVVPANPQPQTTPQQPQVTPAPIASPAGAVRELPDETPPKPINVVVQPPAQPQSSPVYPPTPHNSPASLVASPVMRPMPSLIDDPFLTPLDPNEPIESNQPLVDGVDPLPVAPPEEQLHQLQQTFRIEVSPEELIQDPFAPIVKPIPAVSPPLALIVEETAPAPQESDIPVQPDETQ